MMHGVVGTTPRTLTEHRSRFVALDGLRGVAAIAVVLYHVALHFGGRQMLPHAYLAVDFFFLLSGFVLAYAYSERLKDGRLGYGDFLVQRGVRLYPLLFLGAALGLICRLAASPHEVAHALKLAPFGAAAIPYLSRSGSLNPLDPPAWSLFFELVASGVFGALALRPSRALALALVAFTGAVFLGWTLASGETNLGVDTARFAWGFVRVGFSFTLGVLLLRLHNRMKRLPRLPFWVLALVLLATFLPARGPEWRLYDVGLLTLVFPAIVLLGANCATEGPRGVWLMERSSDLSYPLYILHWPLFVGATLGLVAVGVDYHAHARPIGIAATVVAIGASLLVLWTYDEPLRAKLRAALKRHQTDAR